MTQWQPIETAPKDGTEILVLVKEGEKALAFYKVTNYYCAWDKKYKESKDWWKGNVTCKPTHWLPVPPPPATIEKGE